MASGRLSHAELRRLHCRSLILGTGMRRREFIGLLGGVAVWPPAATAQQADRVRRLGWLDWAPADDPAAQARAKAVQQDLANLGWVVGRNLQIDYRWRGRNQRRNSSALRRGTLKG